MRDPLPPGLPVQAYANPLGEDLGAPDPLDALPSGMRDYLALQPVPPTTPDLLGLGAPPAPPAPPPMLGPKGSNVGDLVALAMAAFLGPGKGTGILQGVQASRMQAEQARQQLAAQHQQIFAQRQRMFQWEAQQYEADARRRQETLEQNVRALQAAIPTLTTKADYDRTLDTFTAGLQAMGLRVDGNYLRSRVPYVSKDGAKLAQDAIERWRKNPQNEQILKEHPAQAALAKVPIDRDGDGVPELVLLDEVMALAGMGFTKDESGAIVWDEPGTSQSDKANADGILADLIAKDRAEGKANTPERRAALRQEAMRRAKQAQDLGPDPTLQAIRALQLENARNKPPAPEVPPALQRRIDTKVRAFESLPIVKRIQLMAESVSFADALRETTTNPADDQALIYAFAKAMDPDSVVREGEYATVQKYAQSWAESFGFNAARIFSNTAFLTPQARRNMKATIRTKFAAAKPQYDNVRKSYNAQLSRMLSRPVDDDEFLTDFGAAFPPADGGPGPAGAAGMPGLTYEDYNRAQKQGGR